MQLLDKGKLRKFVIDRTKKGGKFFFRLHRDDPKINLIT
jgi:hypothetical protein